MGPPERQTIDSFYYDKQNRVTKKVGRQMHGYVGELAVADICSTKTFKYGKNMRIETASTTYTNWGNETITDNGQVVEEYVYHPNGLLRMSSYNGSIMNYSVYGFYR